MLNKLPIDLNKYYIFNLVGQGNQLVKLELMLTDGLIHECILLFRGFPEKAWRDVL